MFYQVPDKWLHNQMDESIPTKGNWNIRWQDKKIINIHIITRSILIFFSFHKCGKNPEQNWYSID